MLLIVKCLNVKAERYNHSAFLVPATGFEPAHPYEHYPLKVACLPISPHGLFKAMQRYKCFLIFFN